MSSGSLIGATSGHRPMLERPQQEVGLHAPPDADQALRLQHQEQDHHHAEGRVVHGEQHARIALGAGQRAHAGLDDVGKQRDEDGAEDRAQQRAHAADDDHGHVLDRQEQREGLDRDEAAVVGKQRAGHGR